MRWYGESDLDAIAEEDPDAVAPHFPGGVAKRLVPVVEHDAEHSVPESLDDLALRLELLFLLSDDGSLRMAGAVTVEAATASGGCGLTRP